MEVSHVLSEDRILIVDYATKTSVLEMLVDKLAASEVVRDKNVLREAVFHRESLMSTGIGAGIAVPHAMVDVVDDIVMAVCVCRRPIEDYETIDGVPVRIVLMMAAAPHQRSEYLRLLSRLSCTLRSESVRDRLVRAESAGEVYQILMEEGCDGKS